MAPSQLMLPSGVVTRADVGRLSKEVEAVNNFLDQAALRQPEIEGQLPKMSRLLGTMIADNKIDMLKPEERQKLKTFLDSVRVHAPILHMSFNSDPSPAFQQRLIAWIREQIDPQMLLQFGLHPNIGAGCVVRTTNKFFDFSLRKRFASQRSTLIDRLRVSDEVANTDTQQQESQQPVGAAEGIGSA